MNIGTWNIQGISTKKDQVFDQLERYRMDIAALTETKEQEMSNKEITYTFTVEWKNPKEQRLEFQSLFIKSGIV